MNAHRNTMKGLGEGVVWITPVVDSTVILAHATISTDVTTAGFSDFTVGAIHSETLGIGGVPTVDLSSGCRLGSIDFLGTIPTKNKAEVLAGHTYINPDNNTYPSGVIRGQLTP